jgi:hypothetical protein
MLFTKDEEEVLKEYSRICLAMAELKEKLNVLKKAKKLYEEIGPESYPVSVYDILSKVEMGKSVAIKEVGVELTNKRKSRMATLTKAEMRKRIGDLIGETEAILVYTNLTDKKYRNKKEIQTIECKVTAD